MRAGGYVLSVFQEFSSAFFFVWLKTIPSLMNANEKDSASMSFE